MHAIEVDHVSKRFHLDVERSSSLKERAVRFGRRAPGDELWALRDVSFDVEEGHTVGLLGHNGSGKSTLLKCLGGIFPPTDGEIRTAGRLASLLELGAGFHPDLTGRENVYLNASILGMSKRDIDARFDDIVGFAEVERFIDQQVKHYSSGMYVRLGFAVATNVDPDILLVDEVLAVGDEAFQRKCLDRVRQFQKEGRTIVFVTHGADLVRQICDRAVVLDHGNLVSWAEPSEAVRVFREHLLAAVEERQAKAGPEPDRRLRIESVTIEYPEAGRPYVRNNEPMAIRVDLHATDHVDDVVVAVALHGSDGHIVFGQNTWGLGHPLTFEPGPASVVFRFDAVALLEGTYPLTVGVHGRQEQIQYDWQEQERHVDVINAEGNHAWGVADLPVTVDVQVSGEERRVG